MTAEQTALKNALETYGRTIDLEIRQEGVHPAFYTSDDIIGCSISHDGNYLTAIMKQAEIELGGVGGPDFAKALKGERLYITLTVNGAGITVKEEATNENPELPSKKYGTFIVKEAEYKDETNSIVITAYDLILLSMIPYAPSVNFTAPEGSEPPVITLGIYLQSICDYLGITLATPTFANSEVIIDEEKYDNSYTFRDVLTEIAQAAGGTIAIKNDQLYVLYPVASEVKVEPSNLKSIEIGEVFGPVNSVVIARTPQEDNIYKKDATAETICEIKIENNQLMDSHREDFIEGIYNALYGLTYYPHEVESFGIGTLEICDLFTIETLDGNTYTALHMSGEVEITQGLVERTKGTAPTSTKTDYKAASETDRRINQTILRVDKQDGIIQGLITKTEEKTNELTGEVEKLTKSVESTMTAEDIKILVSTSVEGKDNIKTSMGYTLNDEGLRIKRSNEEIENLLTHEGMYVNRNDDNILTADKKGVDAINLKARQYLIVGENSRFEDYDDNRTACFYIGG